MLKIAFEYLTSSFSLLEDPVENYKLMAIIAAIAFACAYEVVGWFYRNHFIVGYDSGHILHWVIKFIVFVGIYYAVATLLRIYKWILLIPEVVWWVVFTVIIIGAVACAIIYIARYITNKK